MTRANQITWFRVSCTPLFFFVFQWLLQEEWVLSKGMTLFLLCLLLVILLLAELSDIADGKIARRYNEVSRFGALIDPFSDVLYRVTCFFCFYQAGIMPLYAFILILWREISMLFLRQLAQLEVGVVISANIYGKIKGCSYGAAVGGGLLYFFRIRLLLGPLSSFSELPHSFWFGMGIRSFGDIWLLGLEWILMVIFFLAAVSSWGSFYLYLRGYLALLKGKRQ